jgi:hypothetical protein
METLLTIAVVYVVALFGTTATLLIASRRPEKQPEEIALQPTGHRKQGAVATEVSH